MFNYCDRTKMFYDEWLTSHRHSLLKEAATMNVFL